MPQMAFDAHWWDALGKDPRNRAYSLANPSNVQHIPAYSIDAATTARIAVPLYSCDKESRQSRTNAIIVIRIQGLESSWPTPRGLNMGSNQDSFQHEVEGNGHYPAMEMRGSKAKVFTEWFREYTAAAGNRLSPNSDIVQAVDSDELDAKFVEQRIKESTPNVPIVKGFCAKCQSLFDHWPTIGDSSTRVHNSKPSPDGGWEHTVARPCNTFELEGSTRSGCRFCTFLLQSLKDTNLLGTFRKIEARLCHLDENALSSLSIQNWGTSPIQLLWLNLPGKICTGCNFGIASSVKFESRFLPESGLPCFADIMAYSC